MAFRLNLNSLSVTRSTKQRRLHYFQFAPFDIDPLLFALSFTIYAVIEYNIIGNRGLYLVFCIKSKILNMGLFSTLTSATTSSDGQANLRKSPQSSTSSSANIPTLVQLYAGDVNNSSSSSNNGAILMENNPLVTGYTTLTYQAVQVGEQASRDDAMKNHQHTNPDLGVWNCRVQQKEKQSIPLIDSLLAKVAPQTSVYCLTVDLSDETSVETNLSSLQAALVRHLIEHPPSSSATTTDTATTETDGEMDIDPATTGSTSSGNNIKTTSLYDLQTAQFGLASEEKAAEQTIEETAKDVKIGLMICAVVGSSSSSRGGGGDDDTNQNNLAADISSESAYKKKQARALVVYHLRKFANAINAALCFVERPAAVENHQSSEGDNKTQTTEAAAAAADDTTTTNAAEDTQIAIPYDKLSQLWRDMAMGIPVWEQQSTETEDTAAATALYGPGRQQEDLIESLLLRNANYPGHWDANKDSLWVALPSTSGGGGGGGTSEMSTQTITTGDGGWLTQLRDSIASALPATDKTSGNEKASADDDGKPKEKDAAVSSFFESLLANP